MYTENLSINVIFILSHVRFDNKQSFRNSGSFPTSGVIYK